MANFVNDKWWNEAPENMVQMSMWNQKSKFILLSTTLSVDMLISYVFLLFSNQRNSGIKIVGFFSFLFIFNLSSCCNRSNKIRTGKKTQKKVDTEFRQKSCHLTSWNKRLHWFQPQGLSAASSFSTQSLCSPQPLSSIFSLSTWKTPLKTYSYRVSCSPSFSKGFCKLK